MASDESGDVAAPQAAEGQSADSRLPAIDFSTFILSLSTTALYQMGLVPDPSSGERIEPDPLIVRQTIDTLEMLRTKTRGNLEPDEESLFDNLLCEIRLRFVELGE